MPESQPITWKPGSHRITYLFRECLVSNADVVIIFYYPTVRRVWIVKDVVNKQKRVGCSRKEKSVHRSLIIIRTTPARVWEQTNVCFTMIIHMYIEQVRENKNKKKSKEKNQIIPLGRETLTRTFLQMDGLSSRLIISCDIVFYVETLNCVRLFYFLYTFNIERTPWAPSAH